MEGVFVERDGNRKRSDWWMLQADTVEDDASAKRFLGDYTYHPFIPPKKTEKQKTS